jgi:hypothetical protein
VKLGVAFASEQHVYPQGPLPAANQVQVFNFSSERRDCCVIPQVWYAEFLRVFCKMLGLHIERLKLDDWIKAIGECELGDQDHGEEN